MVQHQKESGAEKACAEKAERLVVQRRQKDWLKHTDFPEIKTTTISIYSNCLNYSSLFYRSFKFRYYWFLFDKKITVNCSSVLRILLFTS